MANLFTRLSDLLIFETDTTLESILKVLYFPPVEGAVELDGVTIKHSVIQHHNFTFFSPTEQLFQMISITNVSMLNDCKLESAR